MTMITCNVLSLSPSLLTLARSLFRSVDVSVSFGFAALVLVALLQPPTRPQRGISGKRFDAAASVQQHSCRQARQASAAANVDVEAHTAAAHTAAAEAYTAAAHTAAAPTSATDSTAAAVDVEAHTAAAHTAAAPTSTADSRAARLTLGTHSAAHTARRPLGSRSSLWPHTRRRKRFKHTAAAHTAQRLQAQRTAQQQQGT